jgi:cob(I)alamin adenosyltransferase
MIMKNSVGPNSVSLSASFSSPPQMCTWIRADIAKKSAADPPDGGLLFSGSSGASSAANIARLLAARNERYLLAMQSLL